jgi:Cd2+/Zn2+-exporting ATPase
MNQVLATHTDDSPTLRLRIRGMDCGSCALTIEKSLRDLPGVRSATVSFTTELLEVTGTITRTAIERRLHELGYGVYSDARPHDVPLAPAPQQFGALGFLRFLLAQPRLRIAALVTTVVILGIPLLADAPAAGGSKPLDVLFTVAVLIVGAPVFVKGCRALLLARRMTIDLLMAIASIGALLIDHQGEAITVMVLYTLGEALEAYSAERARNALRSLMSLQPSEATVLREHRGNRAPEHAHEHEHEHDHEREHADEHEDDHDHGHDHLDQAASGSHPPDASGCDVHHHQIVLPVERIGIGDIVLVRPGQRIPVDGEILRGVSAINQAVVTGESEAVLRGPGDAVLAGTVNGDTALEIRVTRTASDATIARIARLVEQAQAQRSPAERFIDRFAHWYTPLVVLLAVLMVLIPVLVLGQPALDSPDGTHGWLYRALALLIVACPCALVISIPVTVVSALARLAHLGVLVKGGSQLDRLADVRAVAFDKTGTLTYGRPQVTAVRASVCDHSEDYAPRCSDCDDVVALAASVERSSEHPVAHAIMAAATERRLAQRYELAGTVTAHPGRGVSGRLGDGARVAVGNEAHLVPMPAEDDELVRHANGARAAGQTVMYVARDGRVVGFIGVQDEVRDASRAALRELHDTTPPVAAIMLTGDNAQAAQRAARQVGYVDDVRADLLPEQKLAAIEELRARYGTVAMVGDGINDAPALARADVGIAMGGGTAQAMETADVVLMQDDMSHLPMALRIARRSRTLIKQNIALSLGLKLAFLALAVPGMTTLWMAVLADVGATLLVTLNGMRVLRAR